MFDAIASGGMASVHFGRSLSPGATGRVVAIKRLHESYAKDPEYVAMMLDEARLVRRIDHPNVVPTLDVVSEGGELWLVMEYVAGESLSTLLKRGRAEARPTPIPVVVDVVASALRGLHAAHVATSETGEPLGIVHRDVSPQNLVVGSDGVTRVLDFGIAKAAGRMQQTRTGTIKGKVRYMAPEQVAGRATHRADVYAAGIVLWEALTGHRLFTGDNDVEVMFRVVQSRVPPPRHVRPDIPAALEDVVMRALRKDPAERFATAWAMAEALRAACTPVTRAAVASWVSTTAGPELAYRARRAAEIAVEPVGDRASVPSRPTVPDGAECSTPMPQVSTLSAFHPETGVLRARSSRATRVATMLAGGALLLLVPLLAARRTTVTTVEPAVAAATGTPVAETESLPATTSVTATALAAPPEAVPATEVPSGTAPDPALATAPPTTPPALPPVPARAVSPRPSRPTHPPSDRIYQRD